VAVDADVLATLESCPGVFEQLGCVVEPACPDLSGAHEVFTTVRAHQFASGLGPIHDANPGVLKAALAWNIELGRALGRAELQQARERHQQLRRRVDAFFQTYDVLLAPVSQVAPFDASIEYPRTVAGKEMPTYLDWMRSCYLISATGCPAQPGSRRADCRWACRSSALAVASWGCCERGTRSSKRRPWGCSARGCWRNPDGQVERRLPTGD
jgi:amidase